MKIASSEIGMDSTRTFIEKDETREDLKVWMGRHGGASSAPGRAERHSHRNLDRVSISDAARARRNRKGSTVERAETTEVDESPKTSDMDDPKLHLVKTIVEAFTGKKIRLADSPKIAQQEQAQPTEAPCDQSEAQTGEGWGLQYDRRVMHYESETVDFTAKGSIQTTDGKNIDFSLKLQLSREQYSEESLSLRDGDAAKLTDPLVLNFDGPSAELSDMKFTFDIDSDGEGESVSFLKPGSGFLALDRNSDDTINDGEELFGAATGNGFSELSAYDEDSNGWIDENDSIYDKLSVWTKDAEGKDNLMGLKESGVGAIYLSSVASQFSLNSSVAQLQGQLNSTGIYVTETGSVRTIQQVDLAV